jgi:hypothetical protein
MGEEAHRYVARYASQYVTGQTFTEVGDVLHQRGFDMQRAEQTEHGVLLIPHKDGRRMAARLFQNLPTVEPEHKHNGDAVAEETHVQPMQVDVAAATFAGAKVEAGIDDGVALKCRECGAVHPEGVVCMVPIFYETRCCLEQTYAHPGPHEASTEEGVITHRWIEERVITDVPFDAYHPLTDEEREEF